jgi:predicted RNA-binding Zn ribbon-like protein
MDPVTLIVAAGRRCGDRCRRHGVRCDQRRLPGLETACDGPVQRPALGTALELREAIFQVFAAIGRRGPAPAIALAVVQRRYADAVAAAQLVPAGAGFDWRYSADTPDRVWWPLAVSAVRLLTAGPLERVKVCAAEAGCIGLFLDTSKNRSRRWCTTDGCGVQAKVQRQARRRQAARSTG